MEEPQFVLSWCKRGSMKGLYAIADADTAERLGLPLLKWAHELFEARPAALQLRAKRWSAQRTLDCLRRLRPAAARAGVPLFANDRADLAMLARCDGVHVGQDDLPIPMVRRLSTELMVGCSTHSLAQLDAALFDRPDYVALGPIYQTSNKSNPDPVVGLEVLKEARIRTTREAIPLVAIGGIDAARAADVASYADAAAVIGALAVEHATDAALRLHRVLKGGSP